MKSLTLTRSPRGRKLNEPLVLKLAEPKNAVEEKLQQYVLDTFLTRQSSLARFTFENSTVVELAKHLLRYRTGSRGTLYNYVYDVRAR